MYKNTFIDCFMKECLYKLLLKSLETLFKLLCVPFNNTNNSQLFNEVQLVRIVHLGNYPHNLTCGKHPQKCANIPSSSGRKPRFLQMRKGQQLVFLECCLTGMHILQPVFDFTILTEFGCTLGNVTRADTKQCCHSAYRNSSLQFQLILAHPFGRYPLGVLLISQMNNAYKLYLVLKVTDHAFQQYQK